MIAVGDGRHDDRFATVLLFTLVSHGGVLMGQVGRSVRSNFPLLVSKRTCEKGR